MAKINRELIDALRTALQNELAGEEFYTKTAEEAKDDFTRNTFKHLAGDELYHIEKITAFIDTGEAVEIAKEIKNRNPKSGLSFFGMNEEEFKKNKKQYEGDFAAYKFAIDIEIKSYDLYKLLNEKSKEKKTKEFFRFLMKEEATHRKIIEEAISFLEAPEDYFLGTEKWHFD